MHGSLVQVPYKAWEEGERGEARVIYRVGGGRVVRSSMPTAGLSHLIALLPTYLGRGLLQPLSKGMCPPSTGEEVDPVLVGGWWHSQIAFEG